MKIHEMSLRKERQPDDARAEGRTFEEELILSRLGETTQEVDLVTWCRSTDTHRSDHRSLHTGDALSLPAEG